MARFRTLAAGRNSLQICDQISAGSGPIKFVALVVDSFVASDAAADDALLMLLGGLANTKVWNAGSC